MLRVEPEYLWIIFFYAGCLSAVELVLELQDEGVYSELTNKLDASEIPYRKDSDGGLYYSDKYYFEVQGILSDVLSNDLPSDRSVHYYDANAQVLFIHELKRQNVPYLVKERHGGRWVVWEKGYEDQVGFAKGKVKTFINENVNNLYQGSEKMRSNKRLQFDAATPGD